MKIWIVNPFDPLPGDPEQEGRYATLARVLVQRGHAVTWWTSTFSHRFKRPVDQDAIRAACAQVPIEVRFTAAPPYGRNVGYARIRNHKVLAARFGVEARGCEPGPDAILVSSPPPVLAAEAVAVARERGAAALIDVQDLWPDNFAVLAPRWVRPLLKPVWCVARHNVRRAARGCDAIIGVADAYAADSLKASGTEKPTATFPLGVDLAALDAAAQAGRCDEFTKPAGETWLAYAGSLNRNYDFFTILRAVAQLQGQLPGNVRFFLTSRGEFEAEARALVAEQKLTNVTMTGFLEWNQWAYLMSQCDAGFNACWPEAMIFLPNKIFYYLGSGCVVLNTIPGQCSRIVQDGGCGFDYTAGDPTDCARAIRRVVENVDERRRMQQAARRLAETEYDRAILFPRYAQFIEQIVTA